MVKKLRLCFFLIFSCINAQIINYEKFIAECTDFEEDLIVLRKLEDSNKNIKYISLHPNTLEVKIIEANQIKERDWHFLEKKYSNSGFALIFNENVKKIKKLDDRSLMIHHKSLKRKSAVKITNPKNGKSLIAEVKSNNQGLKNSH